MDAYREFILKKRAILDKRGYLLDCSMINPDLSPPESGIRELIREGSSLSSHRYTVARGIEELRESFAEYYQDNLGVTLNPETQICVTSGTKDALSHFLSVVCVPGDAIGVISPVYPMYRQVALGLGLRICEGNKLEDLSGVRAVVLNSPQNPTGQILNPSFVQSWALQNKTAIFHDAVYVDMVAGSKSFLSDPLVPTLESLSLSKSFSVPGWRIGCVAGDEDLIDRVATRRSRLDYGVFYPIQKAASFLLTKEAQFPKELALRYQHRGKLFKRNSLGLPFLWISARPELADYLLNEYAIAVLPGSIFSKDFEGYIRIALVLSEEKLVRVMSAIENFKEHNEVAV